MVLWYNMPRNCKHRGHLEVPVLDGTDIKTLQVAYYHHVSFEIS